MVWDLGVRFDDPGDPAVIQLEELGKELSAQTKCLLAVGLPAERLVRVLRYRIVGDRLLGNALL